MQSGQRRSMGVVMHDLLLARARIARLLDGLDVLARINA
jgi:hypothetical protein